MSIYEVKAIPTKYNGVKFRSRLEARWAVFLDAMNLEWEYEKEGYQLSSGWYLPDFWIPQMSLWLEVKPENFECQHAESLEREVGSPVVVASGLPGNPMAVYTNLGKMKAVAWMWWGSTVVVVDGHFPDQSGFRIAESDDHLDGSGHLEVHALYGSAIERAKKQQFTH